jgi:putative Holliday junction resolvase
MSGHEGTQAQRVRSFCDALANAGVEVVYQDERMTTVQSERLLIESGMRRNKRREVVDKMAAALILQAYLDAQPRGQDA